MRDLADRQRPGPPVFESTALPNIWVGRPCGTEVVLKRSERPLEGLVYRYLAAPHHLPAPGLLELSPDLGGDGCWLVLEPVECTPPGLSPRAPTHWWQSAPRRDRALTMIAALHARFWNRADIRDELTWLPRYGPASFWSALDDLSRPRDGWTPLSGQVLGQLASGAEMLIAGPETLIHGSLTANDIGWRGQTPVLLDWERTAWATPYADLGRLFSRWETDGEEVSLLTDPAWRRPLLELYRAVIETIVNTDLDAETVALGARCGMLWELAVDLHRAARDPEPAGRAAYEQTLRVAEELADEP